MSATAAKSSTQASKKHPGGRPSKYSLELAARICFALSEGRSLRWVCRQDWSPEFVTVWTWLREKPEFLNQYARAKQEASDAMAEDILDIADNESDDWQRARLRIDTRKWIMAKMKPKKYGEKTEVDFNAVNPVTFISEVPAPKINQEDPLPNETDSPDSSEVAD